MHQALPFFLAAAAAYLLGCINGSILTSKLFFHEDIREKGSGNAGLTNFFRIYGAKCVGVMLSVDIVKMLLGVTFGMVIFRLFGQDYLVAKYWAGFFVVLGHAFPCMFGFKGGKGILSSGTMLCLLDWRIAAVGLGLFLITLVLTRYVSLGSILAAASFPFTTWWVFGSEPNYIWLQIISAVLAAGVIFLHRSNIKRLLQGKENKFSFHCSK